MIAQIAVSRGALSDYIELTKPRIISLLLFTATGGMFLASRGPPDLTLLSLVLVAGALAAGGANALNHCLDRDIDARMSRTLSRPVVAGRIQSREALVFGTALNAISFMILSAFVNPLSALLTLSATLFYVFVYTKSLKRTTPQNIVIGGAAGAIPPVVGWTAVTGHLDLSALYLFAIVLFWTPPHFWALSLLLKDDYARARIPMLPVVVGVAATKRSILLYTALVVALTLMFFTTGSLWWIYLASASALGAGFLFFAWRLLKLPGIAGARRLFSYSMLYLALLFVAIMVDSTVVG